MCANKAKLTAAHTWCVVSSNVANLRSGMIKKFNHVACLGCTPPLPRTSEVAGCLGAATGRLQMFGRPVESIRAIRLYRPGRLWPE